MSTPIVYNESSNGQTKPAVALLGGQTIEVTTSSGTPPTVTLDATLLVGSLDITADNGATAVVDVIASAVGALSLNAHGGVIDASSAVGALSGVDVNIADGGDFIAESSFLSILNNSTITFAADTGHTDTLTLNNAGGLLNFSVTAPLVGFQNGGEDVLHDRLIAGARVASYSITQVGASQPDILTFYDVGSQVLGSISFNAGTFNAGQLGDYAVGLVGGPLQVSVGADGGIMATTNGDVVAGGGGQSYDLGANNWMTLNDSGGNWDTVTGSNGKIYVTNAQGSITGGGDIVYFDHSTTDAVSLYNTAGNWDSVFASHGVVDLINAQASVTGGGDTIYTAGSNDALSLYHTAGAWDAVYGSHLAISLTDAQSSVIGGANSIYLDGSSSDAVSIYNTGGAWDSVFGSHASIVVTNAQVNVTGGSENVYLNSPSGDAVSLFNTAGGWDTVRGSGATVNLSGAQASVVGGGDAVYMDSSAGNATSLYNTGGVWDSVVGSNASLSLTNAQANLTGTGDTVYFGVGASSSLNLSGTALLSFYQGIGGHDVVTGAGAGDAYRFSKNDFADFSALSSHLTQTQDGAFITLDAHNSVELVGVKAANLTASQFSFV